MGPLERASMLAPLRWFCSWVGCCAAFGAESGPTLASVPTRYLVLSPREGVGCGR